MCSYYCILLTGHYLNAEAQIDSVITQVEGGRENTEPVSEGESVAGRLSIGAGLLSPGANRLVKADLLLRSRGFQTAFVPTASRASTYIAAAAS